MQPVPDQPHVAIACGGTGGHLFPGLAVGEALRERGVAVTLIISPKEVDQAAVRSAAAMRVVTLPAVGLSGGRWLRFLGGFWRSYRASVELFRGQASGSGRPTAVLAMGGFTSAPPVCAARRLGIPAFLHESNAIPGRANRWLASSAREVFLGFPQAADRLRTARVRVTGTPVRPQFQPMPAENGRAALGLRPDAPVLLVMGGSQGARAVNDLALRALPLLAERLPALQVLHLTGANDFEQVRAGYAAANRPAVVRAFLSEMELALSAATVAVSRAGASSLAELAAMRLPAVLIPYPAAVDDHQLANARALVDSGAARMLVQREATPEKLAALVGGLIGDLAERQRVQSALAAGHHPRAAADIAERILDLCGVATSRAGQGRGLATPVGASSLPRSGATLPPTLAEMGRAEDSRLLSELPACPALTVAPPEPTRIAGPFDAPFHAPHSTLRVPKLLVP